jgi:hypothetical protein
MMSCALNDFHILVHRAEYTFNKILSIWVRNVIVYLRILINVEFYKALMNLRVIQG